MKTFSLTRQELYDQVWSTPMIKLAKEYYLANYNLRKICENFDIPIPPRGYWRKLEFGKTIEKTPLPKPEQEQEIKINVVKENI